MLYKLIALLAATLLSTAALADDQEKSTMRTSDATFKSLDRDTDERLSQTEVSSEPQLAQNFTQLDKDSDGYLSKREFTAYSRMEKQQQGREY
jgi:Ca2+-binding EF-hand superfamily protein